MTTLPVDVGWLIVAVFILTPALTYLATIEANHAYTKAYRRDMRDREKALNDRAVRVLEREHAVWAQELKLGRAAHDTSTQAKAALYQASVHDTEISMPRIEM